LALAVCGTLVAGLLGVFAFVLASTQSTSRHEAEQRFRAQATIAASLTGAVLSTLEGSEAPQASRTLGGTVDARQLTAFARRSGDAYAMVTAANGTVIAAAAGTPPTLGSSSPDVALALRQAGQGHPWFSDTIAGPGGTLSLVAAIPFVSNKGTRIAVIGLPVRTLFAFFSNYLRGSLEQPSHGFILDSTGRILGSSVSTVQPAQIVSSSLSSVLRHGAGSYHGSTGQRYVATAPIGGSRWRVAITAPVGNVYTALAGSQRWVLWLVFAAFAFASFVGLYLLARTLSGAALISSQSQELARTNDALRRANGELDAFSYSVSHDLRAPLRAIDGFSQILVREHGDALPAEGQRYLGIVRRNALEMGELIDGLLTFSRLGQQEIGKRTVDVERLCREIVADVQSDSASATAHITVGHLPSASADPTLLRQVFVNLLSNALKYSRDSEAPEIEIGATTENGVTAYYVKDNGVGFEMRYADKLFKVFQRLHRAEDYEGTGIGLALVARIVGRHGGRVWAQATPDEGATFYFTLSGEAR
jgi:signal transduction histidine kinase